MVPAYMIPKFLPVAHMPLGTTEKVDCRQLRESAEALSRGELEAFTTPLSPQDKCMPSTEAENSLQMIWAQVLNVEARSIGIEDSFFRLGGDS